MTKSPIKNAHTLLHQGHSQLAKLLKTAGQMDEINHQIRALLPEALRAHCYVCNLKNGRLILATDNAHWMTRLKFELPALLSNLRKQPGFEHLSGIDCKISPKLTHKIDQNIAPKKQHFLSVAGKSALDQIKKLVKI